jgi:hypothetical protein
MHHCHYGSREYGGAAPRLAGPALHQLGEASAHLGQYPIDTPVRGEQKINRTYRLSVSEFYF